MRELINKIDLFESAAEIESMLDNAVTDGKIAKRDWDDIKYKLNRKIEIDGQKIRDIYLATPGEQRDALGNSEAMEKLYYDVAHGANELNRTLKSAKPVADTEFGKAAIEFANQYIPVALKLKALKDNVVTATQQRAAKKDAEVVQKRVEKDTQSTLVNVLEPFRNDYVEEARKKATQWIKSMKNRITEKGSVDEIAPPITQQDLKNLSYKEREEKQKRRDFWKFIDSVDPSEYVEEQAKMADARYEAWIFKLIAKVGKRVVWADMKGNPWTGSTLNVETEDGEKQTWNTQMILNTSKLGKLFNQFPTRRAK
jgi:hypothetical protein